MPCLYNDTYTESLNQAAGGNSYGVKAWKQIDLSKPDVDKLREEYRQAPHKNIEIADLRAFHSR